MREAENFVVMQRSERGELDGKGDVVSVLVRMPPPLFSFEGKRKRRRGGEGGPNPLPLSRSISVKSGRSWGGRRSNQQRRSGLRGLSSGRYGRHVSAVREFPKFWDKYVE